MNIFHILFWREMPLWKEARPLQKQFYGVLKTVSVPAPGLGFLENLATLSGRMVRDGVSLGATSTG